MVTVSSRDTPRRPVRGGSVRKNGDWYTLTTLFLTWDFGPRNRKCNSTKEKGVPAISLLRYKFSNIFVGKSMYMQQQTGTFTENFSKNAFYRFMNSVKTNWLRLTSLVAANIVNNDISKLTSPDRKNVFIIDDSLFNRTGCKKTELSSRVFDHVSMSYQKGYRMLTLCWSDGNSLLCYTLRLSNEQISVFMLDFESRLPKYLQNALHPKPKTV